MVAQLYHGDAAEVLASGAVADCSVSAILQDPPAGMDFMGLEWDQPSGEQFRQALERVFVHCIRVLRPGHWSLTWAHPKTSHWTAVALETAGFEIVTKLIHLNAEAKSPAPGKLMAPGHEEWILARRPGPSIPLNLRLWTIARHPRTVIIGNGYSEVIDQAIGLRKSGSYSGKRKGDGGNGGSSGSGRHTYGQFAGTSSGTGRLGSAGGVSRYFPSEEDLMMVYAPRARLVNRQLFPGGPDSQHPTAKSVRLMLALLDLILGAVPETSRTVLDPFMGSGPSGAAATILGADFVGVDADSRWVDETRIRTDWYAANTTELIPHNQPRITTMGEC